jgi:hypothetical protein
VKVKFLCSTIAIKELLKMPMTPQLFSISGAAVELGMDRRTIAAALTDSSPDGKVGKHPAWRLRTILAALGMGKGSGKISNADLDEMERVAETFMAGLKRVEAEPDIAKRREMMREVGPNFGRLDALWTRVNATMPPNEQAFCEHYQEMVMGRLLGEVLALCNWKIRPENLKEGANA